MNVEEKEIQEGIEEKEQVASLAEQTEKKEGPSLDLILDIPLEVTVELGSTKILVKDLLKLGQGSILELNKLASEPLEVLINGSLIAKGEVVVINENFGVRVIDIISPDQRVEQLKG